MISGLGLWCDLESNNICTLRTGYEEVMDLLPGGRQRAKPQRRGDAQRIRREANLALGVIGRTTTGLCRTVSSKWRSAAIVRAEDPKGE